MVERDALKGELKKAMEVGVVEWWSGGMGGGAGGLGGTQNVDTPPHHCLPFPQANATLEAQVKAGGAELAELKRVRDEKAADLRKAHDQHGALVSTHSATAAELRAAREQHGALVARHTDVAAAARRHEVAAGEAVAELGRTREALRVAMEEAKAAKGGVEGLSRKLADTEAALARAEMNGLVLKGLDVVNCMVQLQNRTNMDVSMAGWAVRAGRAQRAESYVGWWWWWVTCSTMQTQVMLSVWGTHNRHRTPH